MLTAAPSSPSVASQSLQEAISLHVLLVEALYSSVDRLMQDLYSQCALCNKAAQTNEGVAAALQQEGLAALAEKKLIVARAERELASRIGLLLAGKLSSLYAQAAPSKGDVSSS